MIRNEHVFASSYSKSFAFSQERVERFLQLGPAIPEFSTWAAKDGGQREHVVEKLASGRSLLDSVRQARDLFFLFSYP